MSDKEGAKNGFMSCVAVYCGAQEPKNDIFNQKARELGEYLAERRIAVVYGGGLFGMMGKMAHGVLDKGGDLTGIIPKFFTEHEHYTPACQNEVIVPDMHTRKKMMFDKAHGFIALPGGIGTMEELTEVITWSGLALHCKPIGMLNLEGYYDHFLLWMKRAVEEKLLPCPSGNIDDIITVSHDPRTLVDKLCSKYSASREFNLVNENL